MFKGMLFTSMSICCAVKESWHLSYIHNHMIYCWRKSWHEKYSSHLGQVQPLPCLGLPLTELIGPGPGRITLTPYMVFLLFDTRFAAYAGGILISFIQPHLFLFNIKCSVWERYHTDILWVKFINMLSMYAQSGMHRHFNWWITAVLT